MDLKNDIPLLEVRNLSLGFHDREQVAVDRVSFSLEKGCTLGLVGASGAGKSSVARAVLRMLKPDTGEILFSGDDILQMDSSRLKTFRQSVQLVFQNPASSLSPRRTVKQTLLEPLNHFLIGDRNYRENKIRQTLQTVGLDDDVLQRFPHQFSSGQQQRIAIARALVTNPDLLIADEAVASLDVSIQAQILQLIRSLQRKHGISFLFISHDLAVIRQLADDVAVMYRGQLLEQAPADVFFSKPAHPYSRALLSYAKYHAVPELKNSHGTGPDTTAPARSMACIYSDQCGEKKPVCERAEPVNLNIENKNHPSSQPHCVKCHLYEEAESNEI